MTFQGDPYRTLGVAPGASLNELKSAYRRLVKQYHPDAAGERALPRFLAIQAAYERLVDVEGRLRVHGPAGSRPGAAQRPGAGPRPSESWRPDATRARASRDAWRARRAGSSGGSTGRGTGTDPGAADGADAPGSGADAAGTSGPGGARRSAPGSGETGRERPRREHHARRGPRTATPGSTSYDEAAELPLDPEWDGGAWYGPSSGTFWTLNPREYADPRKHGPEYLARARRAGTGRPGQDADPRPPGRAGSRADTRREADGTDPFAADPFSAADASDDDPRWHWSGDDASAADDDASTTGGGAEWGTRAWSYDIGGDAPTHGDPPGADGRSADGCSADGRSAGPGFRAGSASRPTSWPAATGDDAFPDLESIARRFAPRSLLGLARRPGWRWRIMLALTGWPPIGYAVGTLVSMISGCSTFAATCPEPMPLLPLVLQPIVVAALILVPPAAAIAAFAATLALGVALPVAAVLSVGSLPDSRIGAPVLGAVTSLAYVVGLVTGSNAVWHTPDQAGCGGPPA